MLTEDQIKFLNRACPGRWAEENGVINVNGDVDMINMNLTQIPVQFGQVNGYFDCSENKLTTLAGTPSIINGGFYCGRNKLMTLEGGPKEVDGDYSCSYNQLNSLIGAPKICNDEFFCSENQLTSLEGCPKLIKADFYYQNNPNLQYFWGIGRVEGYVYYDNENKINEWIITCARRNVIFPHFTLEENIQWIKREQKYSCLLGAPQEILQHFSPRILNLVDSGMYNESKILDYKTFNRIC